MAVYQSPQYLPEIAGLAAAICADFDQEQWTTCYIGHLDIGEVFALPNERNPIRPVVLTMSRVEPIVGETYGWVIGEVRYIDTGEPTEFKLRANRSVLTRCDLHYVAR